jgi:hypothetical protein
LILFRINWYVYFCVFDDCEENYFLFPISYFLFLISYFAVPVTINLLTLTLAGNGLVGTAGVVSKIAAPVTTNFGTLTVAGNIGAGAEGGESGEGRVATALRLGTLPAAGFGGAVGEGAVGELAAIAIVADADSVINVASIASNANGLLARD